MVNSKTRSMILPFGGLWLVLTAGTVLVRMHSTWATRLIVPSVLVGLFGLILAVVGFRSLWAARRSDSKPPEDYRHTYLLFGAVVGVLGLGLVARALVVPPSFGEFGSFRGQALVAAQRKVPGYQGKARCAKCHKKQAKLHDKDAHARVQCEACHGLGRDHAAAPKVTKMKIGKGKQACLVCHQHLEARTGSFGQVDWKKHYKFVGVKDHSISCTKCHNPHEPLFMDRDLRSARLHPLIHRCRDCHTGAKRDPSTPRPASHPVIFECKNCHKSVIEDFAKRPHKKVRCTTCHLFFKKSDWAGRIIRDADPRFCLLCHRKAKFRSKDSPPGIDWPSHREDMGGDADTRCIDCHQDKIHKTSKGGSR